MFSIVHEERDVSLSPMKVVTEDFDSHVENSRAFSRYRDIDEEMAKEVILKLE